MEHRDPEGMITALIALALAVGVWLADPVLPWGGNGDSPVAQATQEELNLN